ncbi:hypothetical protein GGI07_000884 [Coemansia sp. Benny D115]|nr:hypothetical protein GGI07_000884 [Coemansia sp. Benny D115]
MDFSRSRGWRAANNSTLSNSSNGSGPLMVKTYGRFRQRIVNRETKGAEEFARATSVRPILADLLGSSSSDSDFEDKTPDSVSSTDRGPSEPKDATKNIKSKAKKPPTKDAAKPGSKSAPKPKSKRGASAKPKNDVLVDEQQETVAASETSHIDTTDTPVIKVAELPSQLSTQTATTKSHTAKPKHKSVAKDENQDTVSALKVDDKLAKSKPKPKAKSKAKSKTKPKPKDVEKGKTKRAPSVENTMVVDEGKYILYTE